MSRMLKLLATTAMGLLFVVPIAAGAPQSKVTSKKTTTTTTTTTTSTQSSTTTTLVSTTSTDTCATMATSQIFAAWGDLSQYFLAHGGSMEDPSAWQGGSFVADNDSYALAGPGKTALRLTGGVSATSPWFCQGGAYPTMRFMVRNIDDPAAKLNVLMYIPGIPGAISLGTITAGAAWAPSPILALPTALLPDEISITNLRVAFTAIGAGADFRVDNVFADPRSRG